MTDDHDALSCPQCQAATNACRVLGGFAEAMEKMIADGYFERMGREAAMRRERAALEAFLGSKLAPGSVEFSADPATGVMRINGEPVTGTDK